jgi:hypothetical protein
MGTNKHMGPDHLGRQTPDSNPIRSLTRSHAASAEVPARHGDKPNIARDASRGKAAFDLKIHGGMTTQTKTGGAAFGGDHKSAIDSLSGQVVVPGKPGSAATTHPLTAAPVAKQYAPALPVPGHRSRTDDTLGGGEVGENHAKHNARAVAEHAERIALGQRIIGEALDCAEPDHPAKLGS